MIISDLENLISEALNIPVIEENDAIIDGCFSTQPWMTESFNGNGEPLNITDHIAIQLFYNKKNDAISAVHELLPVLMRNNIYANMPDYSWQKDGNLYMVTINVNC